MPHIIPSEAVIRERESFGKLRDLVRGCAIAFLMVLPAEVAQAQGSEQGGRTLASILKPEENEAVKNWYDVLRALREAERILDKDKKIGSYDTACDYVIGREAGNIQNMARCIDNPIVFEEFKRALGLANPYYYARFYARLMRSIIFEIERADDPSIYVKRALSFLEGLVNETIEMIGYHLESIEYGFLLEDNIAVGRLYVASYIDLIDTVKRLNLGSLLRGDGGFNRVHRIEDKLGVLLANPHAIDMSEVSYMINRWGNKEVFKRILIRFAKRILDNPPIEGANDGQIRLLGYFLQKYVDGDYVGLGIKLRDYDLLSLFQLCTDYRGKVPTDHRHLCNLIACLFSYIRCTYNEIDLDRFKVRLIGNRHGDRCINKTSVYVTEESQRFFKQVKQLSRNTSLHPSRRRAVLTVAGWLGLLAPEQFSELLAEDDMHLELLGLCLILKESELGCTCGVRDKLMKTLKGYILRDTTEDNIARKALGVLIFNAIARDDVYGKMMDLREIIAHRYGWNHPLVAVCDRMVDSYRWREPKRSPRELPPELISALERLRVELRLDPAGFGRWGAGPSYKDPLSHIERFLEGLGSSERSK